MINIAKDITDLVPEDLERCPVWEFVNNDELGATVVRQFNQLPVTDFENKVVGDHVRFANGTDVFGLIGNLDIKNPELTKHFLNLSIWIDGKWYHLPRYHDLGYLERGPTALSCLLKLDIDEIFPISFDVRRFSKGGEIILAGQVLKEPVARLSRAQLIALAVP